MSTNVSPDRLKRGRTLKLFLADGSPSGVITAELGVSSVRAVVASRTSLPDLIRREEASRTGVYLLTGPDPDVPSRPLVYVGEGDQVKVRLSSHDAAPDKDFFTRAVLIVFKDENLHKAHALYLEGRLIEAIGHAGRAKLVNVQIKNSSIKRLPEAETADMDRVLDEIELLLPVLGFDVLTPVSLAEPQQQASGAGASAGTNGADAASPIFTADINAAGIMVPARGRAIERGGEFVVFEGSTAFRRETPGITSSAADKRKLLIETGVLVPDVSPDLYRFAKNVSFSSPTGASAAIAGRSDRGPETWRVEGDGAYLRRLAGR